MVVVSSGCPCTKNMLFHKGPQLQVVQIVCRRKSPFPCSDKVTAPQTGLVAGEVAEPQPSCGRCILISACVEREESAL